MRAEKDIAQRLEDLKDAYSRMNQTDLPKDETWKRAKSALGGKINALKWAMGEEIFL